MSQVAWLRGPVCGVDNCRSRLYRLNAGRKFCQFGHVVEGNFEFDDDDGIATTQTRRLNVLLTDTGFGSRASQPGASQAVLQAQKRLYGAAGRVQYLRCLQHLLRQLVPQAVDEFLPQLSPDARAAHVAELERATKLVWMRCATAALAGAMPANLDLYVILYLAMRHLNHHPVGVDAFVAALKCNRLHYLRLYALLPKDMAQMMPVLGIALLAHDPAPVDDLFYRGICRWTKALAPAQCSTMPVEHGVVAAFRVVADLELGEAPLLLVLYHRLVLMVHPKQITATARGVAGLPECQLVAYVFLAAKLFLLAHPSPVDPRSWGAWLDSQRSPLPFLDHKYHHMDTEQLLLLSDAHTERYCQWVRDALVDEDADELLGTMDKKLLRIFAMDPPATERPTPPPPPLPKPPRFAVLLRPLHESEVADAERHLLAYLCYRFGLKPATLQQAVKTAYKHVEARVPALYRELRK